MSPPERIFGRSQLSNRSRLNSYRLLQRLLRLSVVMCFCLTIISINNIEYDFQRKLPSLGRNTSVLFISQNPQFGSAKMRGVHFINEWKHSLSNLHHLIDGVASCSTHVCADICVFIGPCQNNQLPLRSCCQIKVLDVVDKYLFHQQLIDEHLHEYDALVVNSSFMKTFFIREHQYSGEILVLLHHSDPRWRIAETSPTVDNLRFGYIGSLPSLKHTDNFLHFRGLRDLYPISLVDTDQGEIPLKLDFQMDISIRPLNTGVAKFKTSAKVATAAALGHNIITTWEEAVKDCLPPDYPFLLKDESQQTVLKMFQTASQDYEGSRKLWDSGIHILKAVNKTLSLSVVALKYESFLVGLKSKN